MKFAVTYTATLTLEEEIEAPTRAEADRLAEQRSGCLKNADYSTAEHTWDIETIPASLVRVRVSVRPGISEATVERALRRYYPQARRTYVEPGVVYEFLAWASDTGWSLADVNIFESAALSDFIASWEVAYPTDTLNGHSAASYR